MEQVWTTNLVEEPTINGHYAIDDFNCALFTVTEEGYTPVQWAD